MQQVENLQKPAPLHTHIGYKGGGGGGGEMMSRSVHKGPLLRHRRAVRRVWCLQTARAPRYTGRPRSATPAAPCREVTRISNPPKFSRCQLHLTET